MLRCYKESDVEKLLAIHEKHYRHEFEFPELKDPKFIGKFVATDDFDNPICFGSVRLIAEAVAITDKCRSVLERREALIKILQASKFVADGFGFDQLHAFIQDPTWERHLKKNGFKECKGRALVTDL
jgi:hypothetical protein